MAGDQFLFFREKAPAEPEKSSNLAQFWINKAINWPGLYEHYITMETKERQSGKKGTWHKVEQHTGNAKAKALNGDADDQHYASMPTPTSHLRAWKEGTTEQALSSDCDVLCV